MMNLIYRLTIITTFILQLTVFAQSQPIMGFQGGINVTGLMGHKDNTENKPRFGLTGYVFADIPLGRNSIVSIETGLGISQQGNRTVADIDSLTWTNTRTTRNKINYLLFPVYLKENYSNFYTKIGPYLALLTSATSEYTNVETKGTVQFRPSTSGNNKKFEENVNSFDYGLSFGFGFIHYFDPKVHRGRSHHKKRTPIMQVDFKYNMGFRPIDATGNIPEMNLKNSVFTFGLSFTSVND